MIDDRQVCIDPDQLPEHLLSVLAELPEAAVKAERYDLADVKRIAQLILRAPGVTSIDDAIARARRYERGPTMFGRSVRMELERQKAKKL